MTKCAERVGDHGAKNYGKSAAWPMFDGQLGGWRSFLRFFALQKISKLVAGNSNVAEDCTKCSGIEFAMVGNDCLAEGIVAAQDDVTSLSATDGKSKFLKCGNGLTTRDARQRAHTVTRNASK